MRSWPLSALVLALVVGCQPNKGEPKGDGGTPPKADGAPLKEKDGGTPKGKDGAAPKKEPGLGGTLMGKPFRPDGVGLEGRKLTFRKGADFFADLELAFELPEKEAVAEGKAWKFGGDHLSHPFLHVSFKEGDGLPKTEMAWPKDYSMSLKFTRRTADVAEGEIDLEVRKPAGTRLKGPFTAVVTRTAQEPPVPEDAPYIMGKIALPGEPRKSFLTAGFVGKKADGKMYANLAGTECAPGGKEWATSSTFKPQMTSLVNGPDGPGFKHTKVPPGEYLVYVRRDNVAAAWKSVAVKAGDRLTADLAIDPVKAGSVAVTLLDEEADGKEVPRLFVIPAGLDANDAWLRSAFEVGKPKKGEKLIKASGLPAGKYRAVCGASEADLEVTAGKETAVKFARPAKDK